MKVLNAYGSAKVLTNVQTFRDCALHQWNVHYELRRDSRYWIYNLKVAFYTRANFKGSENQHWSRAAGTYKNTPGFPVAEHFSSNGHTAADALVRGIKLCDGNKQRKRQEMRLIFWLVTCQPRGLNGDFHFIWSSRARAKRNFQILIQYLELWRNSLRTFHSWRTQSRNVWTFVKILALP